MRTEFEIEMQKFFKYRKKRKGGGETNSEILVSFLSLMCHVIVRCSVILRYCYQPNVCPSFPVSRLHNGLFVQAPVPFAEVKLSNDKFKEFQLVERCDDAAMQQVRQSGGGEEVYVFIHIQTSAMLLFKISKYKCFF